MPSFTSTRNVRVVLRFRKPEHERELRDEIEAAYKQQKQVARTLPYRDQNSAANKKITQHLNSPTQTYGPGAPKPKLDRSVTLKTTRLVTSGRRVPDPLVVTEKLQRHCDTQWPSNANERTDNDKIGRKKAVSKLRMPREKLERRNSEREKFEGEKIEREKLGTRCYENDTKAALEVRKIEEKLDFCGRCNRRKRPTNDDAVSIVPRSLIRPSGQTATFLAGETSYIPGRFPSLQPSKIEPIMNAWDSKLDPPFAWVAPDSMHPRRSREIQLHHHLRDSRAKDCAITDSDAREALDTSKEVLGFKKLTEQLEKLNPGVPWRTSATLWPSRDAGIPSQPVEPLRPFRDVDGPTGNLHREASMSKPAPNIVEAGTSFAARARISESARKPFHRTQQDPGQIPHKAKPSSLTHKTSSVHKVNRGRGVENLKVDGDYINQEEPVCSFKQVPKAVKFRTKAELWQYLHPEAIGGAPPYQIISDALYELPAPAYEAKVSEGSGLPTTAIQTEKAKCRAPDYKPRRSSQRAEIRPEHMWLHSPRSCSTCGTFGLLPLYYCAQCKTMRIDMCSDCYEMGHDSCQKLGHDVMETKRLQDIPSLHCTMPKGKKSCESPVAKSGAEIDHYQSINKLLAFLTEERVFMREEINQARLNAVTEQLTVRGQAESTAFRMAKLRLLPPLITEEGGRERLVARKPSDPVPVLRSITCNDTSFNQTEVEDGHQREASRPSPQSNPDPVMELVPSKKLEPGNSLVPVSSPKIERPVLQSSSSEAQSEIVTLSASLRKQEQLQSIHERELCLREKALEMREREELLQLKERRNRSPGHHENSSRLSQIPAVACLATIATNEATLARGLVEMPRQAPDTPSQGSELLSEYSSLHSEASMVERSSIDGTLESPSGPVTPKREIPHLSSFLITRLLANFFSHKHRKGTRRRTGSGTRRSGGSQAPKTPRLDKSEHSTTTRKRIRKRSLSRSNSGKSNQSETDEESNRRRKKVSMTASHGPLWACPYAKFDPLRYSGRNTLEPKYRGCSTHCLRDIPRLKQHLYRVHRQPVIYCPRCYIAFESKLAANEHARLPIQCATVPCPFPEKFDEDRTKELKKRQPRKTDKECWYFIYELLFPGANRPSHPYLEDLGELLVSQLSSRAASHDLSQLVIAHLNTQFQNGSNSAGLFTIESQARVTQAIEDSLPAFLQQMLKWSTASASSSSPSLHDSGTTPDPSSFHQHSSGPDNRVHPPASQLTHGVDQLQADDGPWTPLLPSKSYNLSKQRTGLSTRVVGPGRRTDPAVATDYQHDLDPMQPSLSNFYGSFPGPRSNDTLQSFSERSGSNNYQYYTQYYAPDDAAHEATSDIFASRHPAASTTQATHGQPPSTAPSQVPRAVQVATLKLRKSMDSGYHSMRTLPLDELEMPENSSGIESSALWIQPSGGVLERASLRSVRFKDVYDETEHTMQTGQNPNAADLRSKAELHSFNPDPSLRSAASAPHDPAIPGARLTADNPDADLYRGSVSDPCLPIFSPSSLDAVGEEFNLYDGESWGPWNP